MKRIAMLSLAGLVAITLATGCATSPNTPYVQKGAGIGAIAGGIAGRLIGHDAAGMWLGATIGTVLGGTVGTVMDQERETIIRSVRQNQRVVIYDDRDLSPINQQTNCRKVTTRQWKEGRLMGEKTHEVCIGNKTTDTY